MKWFRLIEVLRKNQAGLRHRTAAGEWESLDMDGWNPKKGHPKSKDRDSYPHWGGAQEGS